MANIDILFSDIILAILASIPTNEKPSGPSIFNILQLPSYFIPCVTFFSSQTIDNSSSVSVIDKKSPLNAHTGISSPLLSEHTA